MVNRAPGASDDARMRFIALLAFAASIPVGLAQTPAAKEPAAKEPVTIDLKMELAAPGVAVPRRMQGAGATARANAWEGRRIAWRLDDRRAASTDEMKDLLEAAIGNRANWNPDPRNEGKLAPPVLRIAPDHDTRWCDLVTAFDAAIAAGFQEMGFTGVALRHLMPKAVDEPIVDGGALVVPDNVFNEPDDGPDRDRPVFDVQQDGRITEGGRTLFTAQPGTEDLEPLQKRLRELRAALEAGGRLEKVEGHAGQLGVPILVRADKWADWRDVRRLLQEAMAPEVGFWRIQIAVAATDVEAPLRAGAEKKNR